MRIGAGMIGRDADGIEGDDFMECPVCGDRFDMRDLGAALEHIHDGPEMSATLAPKPKKPRHPEGLTDHFRTARQRPPLGVFG
jgi:hypothetical protein